jgi:NAD(P)-dependent dehydrogenase (short-subunit alcohol dehydrogenase family)
MREDAAMSADEPYPARTRGPRLEGKTAVIVGAGQTPGATFGNGRATAVRFGQEGAHLLLVDRDESSVNETRAMVLEAGGRAEVSVVDIAESGGPGEVRSRALEVLGRIDILHHNVGIGAGDNTPTKLTDEAWDRILDVNLKAMWRTCKEFVPVMREQNGGAIVCVSSIAAVASAGHLTAYKISKAGVNALVQSLAMTNARYGIRVNAVMPGLIDTPMAVDAAAQAFAVSRDEFARGRDAMVPLRGKQGSAWDVANAALFLASDEASFITGAILPVDGGQSAKVG